MICVASSVAGSPCGAEEGDDSHCLRERRIGWECPSDVGGESVAAIAEQVLGRQRRVQAAQDLFELELLGALVDDLMNLVPGSTERL